MRVRRLAAVVAAVLPLLAMSTLPAEASAVGGGHVLGAVTIAPGLDLSPRPVAWSFFPITLDAAITVTSGGRTATYAGPMSTSVITGGSAVEDCIGGAGIINTFTFSGATPAGSIAGTASGVYERQVGAVQATLNAVVTVTAPPNGSVTSAATIVVNADFTPTTGNCVSQPVTSASVSGTWSATA